MSAVERAIILLPGRAEEKPRPAGSPLRRLLGLTLVQRTVLAAAQSGVKRFLLVGEDGSGWEAVTAAMGRDRRVVKSAIGLEFIPAERLAEVAGRGWAGTSFWLLRGNLVFDPALLGEIAGEDRAEGKPLRLDGGLALCPAGRFAVLVERLAAPGGLQAGADILAAAAGPAAGGRTVGPGARFCLEVSDRASFRTAERRLLNTARKPTDGFFSRHFNRRISLFLTRLFLKTGVAPAVQSVATLLIGLASGWFVAQGGYGPSALGAFLFDFASIFDGCDGENARLTYRISKFGGFLDITGDAFIFVLFFLCLPVGLYRASRNVVWLWLGGLALVSMGLFYAQLVRYMKRKRLGNNIVAIAREIEASGARPGLLGRVDAIAGKMAFIYRRDFFSTAACLIVLAGGAGVLMGLLGVFMPLQAVYMFLFSRHRLSQAGRPA